MTDIAQQNPFLQKKKMCLWCTALSASIQNWRKTAQTHQPKLKYSLDKFLRFFQHIQRIQAVEPERKDSWISLALGRYRFQQLGKIRAL